MKILTLVTLIAFILSLLACGNDDKDNPVLPNPYQQYVGNYQVIGIIDDGYIKDFNTQNQSINLVIDTISFNVQITLPPNQSVCNNPTFGPVINGEKSILMDTFSYAHLDTVQSSCPAGSINNENCFVSCGGWSYSNSRVFNAFEVRFIGTDTINFDSYFQTLPPDSNPTWFHNTHLGRYVGVKIP